MSIRERMARLLFFCDLSLDKDKFVSLFSLVTSQILFSLVTSQSFFSLITSQTMKDWNK